jgi:hypothetical protein
VSRFNSYPGGAGMTGQVPAHQAPIIGVDADWVAVNGSRAQRRRVAREVKRQAALSKRKKQGGA